MKNDIREKLEEIKDKAVSIRDLLEKKDRSCDERLYYATLVASDIIYTVEALLEDLKKEDL